MTETKEAKSKVSMVAVKSQTTTRSVVNVTPYQKSMSRMKMRRPSYGFSGVAGVKGPAEKSSQIALEFKRPPVTYLNTYQLDPRLPWNVPMVAAATEEVLKEYFTEHKYNIQESPALALRLSREVLLTVKSMCFNRYRIISVVTIGQRRAQSYNNAVTFLWDCERDNYVDIEKEETNCFIQVTVFGIYLD